MTEYHLTDYRFRKNSREGIAARFADEQEFSIPAWTWVLVVVVISLLIVVR